jgi:hypothetical protein
MLTPPTHREVIAETEEAGDHDARMSTGGDGSACERPANAL